MKVQYKDKFTVEGTPDEVMQFIKQMEKTDSKEQSTPEPEVIDKPEKRHYTPRKKGNALKLSKSRSKNKKHRTFGALTKQKQQDIDKAIEYMIKNPGTNITKAMQKATGKNISNYGDILRKRARSTKFKDRFNAATQDKPVKSGPDGRTKRMSFIASRAKSLMDYNNYSREKASKIASDEWSRGGSLLKSSSTSNNKPSLIIITGNQDRDKLLLDMLGNIAKNNGELKFPRDANAIGINSVESWRNAVTKVFNEIETIVKVLCVSNKFKLRFINSTPSIKYGE